MDSSKEIEQSIDLLDLVLKGGPVMMLLLVMSIATFAIVILKLYQFYKSGIYSNNKFNTVFTLVREKKILEAQELLNKIVHPSSKIILSIINN